MLGPSISPHVSSQKLLSEIFERENTVSAVEVSKIGSNSPWWLLKKHQTTNSRDVPHFVLVLLELHALKDWSSVVFESIQLTGSVHSYGWEITFFLNFASKMSGNFLGLI